MRKQKPSKVLNVKRCMRDYPRWEVTLDCGHWDGDVADYFNECIRALKKKENSND